MHLFFTQILLEFYLLLTGVKLIFNIGPIPIEILLCD